MGFLRQVLAYLCMFVYNIIAYVYELFINISRVELLRSDEMLKIYQRITLILAIVMVFYITFEFVKFVVQPDGLTDKEKGAQKTVMKMVIVVILIAFVPNIFSWGYKFQNIVFENQLFSKIILGKQDVEMGTLGQDFSANLLNMFYYVEKDFEESDCGEGLTCKNIVNLNLNNLRQKGELKYLTMGLDKEAKVEVVIGANKKKVKDFKINFNGLFAVGVGAFVAWMLILYCVDAGVRVAQLAFLQIIAPIPIIGYLSPKKDGIFQKWVKQCVTTYLDLFIRVGIIYFILLIAQILTKAVTDGTILENATDTSGFMKTLMFIAIIMGLLLFAKKMPDMLKELFPNTGAASGNFGLKAGSRVAPMAARAIGAGLGATRLLGGAVGRGVRAGIRNARNGYNIFTKRGQENMRKQQHARREARKEYWAARKAAKQANKVYRKSDSTSPNNAEIERNRTLANERLDNARNQYAERKNKGYRSVALNALGGGIQGAWQGATTGGKATELKDIGKQVVAGYKKNDDSIKKYEQYLNDGGAGGITGWADRKITQVGSNVFGLPTRSESVEQKIKNYDTQISEEKQIAAVESSVMKSADASTDTNMKKIEDGKLDKIRVDKSDAAKLSTDLGLNLKGNESIKDIYNGLKAQTADLKKKADEASKKASENPTDSALQNASRIAQEKVVEAEQNLKKKLKKMGEYVDTLSLRDLDAASISDAFDQGAVSSLRTAIKRLKDASVQPKTMEKLRDLFTRQGLSSQEIEKYMNYAQNPTTIHDREVLDKLSKALNTIATTRESDTQELENAKNRLSSGSYRTEVKANDELNNSGSNK